MFSKWRNVNAGASDFGETWIHFLFEGSVFLPGWWDESWTSSCGTSGNSFPEPSTGGRGLGYDDTRLGLSSGRWDPG